MTARYLSTRITADGREGFAAEPGRYRLVVSWACPWANRTSIVRRLLGLEAAISLAVAAPTHDARGWSFDLDPGGRDPVLGIERLEEAYRARSAGYDGGVTVPALVEVATGRVVTNDFDRMTLDLSTEWRAHHRPGAPDLYPADRCGEIDAVNGAVHREVNQGVYRCGYATTQAAYDGAFARLFSALDGLSDRLAGRRFLVGDTITEADVRLFTTLVRFDSAYHGLYRCNRHKLTEMPVLWAYARDLFQTPGFGDTVDFDHVKRHYYGMPGGGDGPAIVPAGPDLSGWVSDHGRHVLGGRPFGDGEPPGPPPASEAIAAGHTPLGAPGGRVSAA